MIFDLPLKNYNFGLNLQPEEKGLSYCLLQYHLYAYGFINFALTLNFASVTSELNVACQIWLLTEQLL